MHGTKIAIHYNILDGLKTLTPWTRGFAVTHAWEALRVIRRSYATDVSCYSKDWCIVTVTFKQLFHFQAVWVSWISFEKLYKIIIWLLLAPTAIFVTYSFLVQTPDSIPESCSASKLFNTGHITVCSPLVPWPLFCQCYNQVNITKHVAHKNFIITISG